MGFTLASEIKTHGRSRGRKIRVKERMRTKGNEKKRFIAEALEPLIKIGRLYVDSIILDDLRHPLVVELKGFPNSKHDDHVDALAGAINELLPSRPTGPEGSAG
jgi:phage terminase large subunit-like protein